jgi:hypothetical protein
MGLDCRVRSIVPNSYLVSSASCGVLTLTRGCANIAFITPSLAIVGSCNNWSMGREVMMASETRAFRDGVDLEQVVRDGDDLR